MIATIFESMPPELCSSPRWVVHKKKVPYQATFLNSKASSTDPSTWAKFEQAQTAYEEGGYCGVGFVLNGDGIVGIDLDKCVHDGEPAPEAMDLLSQIGCQYIELSPSGKGLRGFGYGENITGKKGNLHGVNVELYSNGRYLTVTGNAIANGPLVKLQGFSQVASALSKPDLQRSTEEDRSHPVYSSVLLCRYPANTLPETLGQRNNCLFELARYLKGTNPQASREELRAIVSDWHTCVVAIIGTQEFAVTLTDFFRAWEGVKQPFGSVMNGIVASSKSIRLPAGIEALQYGKSCNHLIRLCVALQEYHGQEPFFIGVRDAGQLIGAHFTDAAKMLSALCSDKVLTLVSKGAGKKASRYRFSWG